MTHLLRIYAPREQDLTAFFVVEKRGSEEAHTEDRTTNLRWTLTSVRQKQIPRFLLAKGHSLWSESGRNDR